MTAGRLGVGIIGSGADGPVLGAALAGAGHGVVGVAVVPEEGRDRVEALLPGVPGLDIRTLVEDSELVLLAVPEAELAAVVARVAEAGALLAGRLVVHTAPGCGTAVLAPVAAAGAIPLAISPAMAFTGTSLDLTRLRSAACAVTAPGPLLPIGQALAVELGCRPVIVREEDRASWVAALTAAVDPIETVVRSSATLLRRIGVEDPAGVLGPLARSALERALTATAPAAFGEVVE